MSQKLTCRNSYLHSV